MAYEEYHINADDVKLDGDPNIQRTVPPSPSSGFDPDNLSTSTNTPVDANLFITKESSTWYVKAFSKVWDYIKSKIGIDNSQGSTNKFLNEQGTFTVVNSGKEYDLEFNQDLDEVTLTEDNVDKTTLPLVATFVGTRTEWNNLSQAEQNEYRIVHFTDDGGYGDAYDIPHGQSNVGDDLDGLADDLGSPSSASAVTGNDAFSKIATLNSNLTGDVLADLTNLNVADSTTYKITSITLDSVKQYSRLDIFIGSSDTSNIRTRQLQIPPNNSNKIYTTQWFGGGFISGTWYLLSDSIALDSTGLSVTYQLVTYTNRHITAIKVIGYKT